MPDAKQENHPRYTPYRSLAQVTNWIKLKAVFLCIFNTLKEPWAFTRVKLPSYRQTKGSPPVKGRPFSRKEQVSR